MLITPVTVLMLRKQTVIVWSRCLLQMAQHYVMCIPTFTKSLGWHVLSLNNNVGVGDLEPVGNALGAIIASPFHDKFVDFLLNFTTLFLMHSVLMYKCSAIFKCGQYKHKSISLNNNTRPQQIVDLSRLQISQYHHHIHCPLHTWLL